MAFTEITVTGDFGSDAEGVVTFRLSADLYDSADDLIVQARNVSAALDQNGQVSIALVANDDPTTQPQNTYYDVTINVVGGAVERKTMVLSHTLPGATFDLSDITV